MPAVVRHHFTVDVEETFQVSAMEPFVKRSDWDSFPSRVDRGTRLLLELLGAGGSTGTFFILGWIAERHPALVREIAAAGHEVASHGYGHERITTIDEAQFRESIRTSKDILEDIIGLPVLGYRAPSFSIVRGGEWALDALIEAGYQYDSSLYPVTRNGYGYAGGPRDPHDLVRAAGVLREYPPATLGIGSAVLPAGGGAYFRHLPYQLVERALIQAEQRHQPATFYIHPWELDTDEPRIAVPLKTRLRHYGGIARTSPRLRRMLSRFAFQSIATSLASSRAHACAAVPSGAA
jgi:polysaccharide deacetylase family protein (PEP-CTERM system associated)